GQQPRYDPAQPPSPAGPPRFLPHAPEEKAPPHGGIRKSVRVVRRPAGCRERMRDAEVVDRAVAIPAVRKDNRRDAADSGEVDERSSPIARSNGDIRRGGEVEWRTWCR